MSKNKIYNISTPTDTLGLGDYDYIVKLTEGARKIGLDMQCLTVHDLIPRNEELQIKLKQGVRNLINVKNFENGEFNKFYELWKKDESRKHYVSIIKEYILKDCEEDSSKPIVNLQLRTPETGFIFMPEDIKDFKISGIKFNITCHEYKLDAYKRACYQAILHPYFQAADTVSFFNPKDLSNACNHALHSSLNLNNLSERKQQDWHNQTKPTLSEWTANFTYNPYNLIEKTILTRVPPTTDYIIPSYSDFEAREPNIIIFGQIRGNKGFEVVLELSKTMKAENIPGRVKIAGNVKDWNLMYRILKEKFTESTVLNYIPEYRKNKDCPKTKNQFQKIYDAREIKDFIEGLHTKNYPEQIPLDIYISPSVSKVHEIFSTAKYCIKFDNKGWANNSSSLINALANGCIVITGWGMDTPKEVLVGGEYEGAIVIIGKKYGLKTDEKLPLSLEILGCKQNFVKLVPPLKKDCFNEEELAVKDPITVNDILTELIKRQKDPLLNEKTFIIAQKLMQEKFIPELIANDFIQSLMKKHSNNHNQVSKGKLEESEGNCESIGSSKENLRKAKAQEVSKGMGYQAGKEEYNDHTFIVDQMQDDSLEEFVQESIALAEKSQLDIAIERSLAGLDFNYDIEKLGME